MMLVHNRENHVFIRVSLDVTSGGIRASSEKDIAMDMRASKATATGGNEFGLGGTYHRVRLKVNVGSK